MHPSHLLDLLDHHSGKEFSSPTAFRTLNRIVRRPACARLYLPQQFGWEVITQSGHPSLTQHGLTQHVFLGECGTCALVAKLHARHFPSGGALTAVWGVHSLVNVVLVPWLPLAKLHARHFPSGSALTAVWGVPSLHYGPPIRPAHSALVIAHARTAQGYFFSSSIDFLLRGRTPKRFDARLSISIRAQGMGFTVNAPGPSPTPHLASASYKVSLALVYFSPKQTASKPKPKSHPTTRLLTPLPHPRNGSFRNHHRYSFTGQHQIACWSVNSCSPRSNRQLRRCVGGVYLWSVARELFPVKQSWRLTFSVGINEGCGPRVSPISSYSSLALKVFVWLGCKSMYLLFSFHDTRWLDSLVAIS